MRRLKFSNAEIGRAAHLLRHYHTLPGPLDSSAQLREWMAEVGEDAVRDLFRLHAADARAAGATEKERYLVASWRRVHEELLASPPLTLSDLAIDGDDLLELGVSRGPAVGILLDELHAEALEDPGVNEREALLSRARELIEMSGLAGRDAARPDESPDG